MQEPTKIVSTLELLNKKLVARITEIDATPDDLHKESVIAVLRAAYQKNAVLIEAALTANEAELEKITDDFMVLEEDSITPLPEWKIKKAAAMKEGSGATAADVTFDWVHIASATTSSAEELTHDAETDSLVPVNQPRH
jgi:hypothetical protein